MDTNDHLLINNKWQSESESENYKFDNKIENSDMKSERWKCGNSTDAIRWRVTRTPITW